MKATPWPILLSLPLLLLLLLPGVRAQDPVLPAAPDSVPGLVARYEVESLHLRTAGGSQVERWSDSSGNGHDLTFEGAGLAALFRTLRLNKLPTVEVQKNGSYLVESPFELGDYTIFLVYRSAFGERALLSSDLQPTHGIMLHVNGKQFLYRAGGVGAAATAYTSQAPRSDAFRVAALGREAGRLRAFLDGVDISSGDIAGETLRVGRMFHVSYSQFVDMDGQGIDVAEMLFFDRFLAAGERSLVSRFLAERYGLAENMRDAEPLKRRLDALRANHAVAALWLATDSQVDLNRIDGVVAVPWTTEERVDAPLGHAVAPDHTRITCARDGTSVRVYVRLGLAAAAAGPGLRLLLLKNGREYQADDAASGRLEAGPATVELETTLYLDTGDWIEAVTIANGEPGEVRLDPQSTLLVAEVQ